MGLFKRTQRGSSTGSSATAGPESLSAEFRSILYFPDGELISDSTLPFAAADLPGIGAQGKIHETISVDGDDYLLDATAREGNAIMSIWSGDVIVTSAVVVTGTDPAWDTTILSIFLKSTLDTELVKHLTADVAAPFGEVLSAAERPFAASLVIPLSSIDATEAVLEWQSRWIAAHLSAVLPSL
jgi:hypothetical protein